MIIEILDYCVNKINGPFYDSFKLLPKSSPLYYAISTVICIYISVGGIFTYKLSFYYITHLIFFNIFNTINKAIRLQVTRSCETRWLKFLVTGIFHEIPFSLLLAVIKYQTYQFISFPTLSLMNRFSHAIISNFCSHLKYKELIHAFTFIINRIMMFLFSIISSYYPVQFNCFIFSYGGVFYLIENLNSLIGFENSLGFTVQYNLKNILSKNTIYSYVLFLSLLTYSYFHQLTFAQRSMK